MQSINTAFTTIPSNSYDFFAWWEPANLWVNYKNNATDPTWSTANTLEGAGSTIHGGGNFIPGKGYLVEYKDTDTKKFTGTLITEEVIVENLAITSGTNKGWHLLGNPFPSAITWGTDEWLLTHINTTAKIWKESTAAYVDIAYGTGIIPALNGFMIQVSDGFGGDNNLTIPLTARVHDATEWYKATGNSSITLVADDPAGQTAQESIIRFDNKATSGFDPEFDSHFLPGYAPRFYSVTGNDQLSTNTLPEAGGTVQIPFGFVKNDGGTFTIGVKTITNIPGPVILNDLKTGVSQDMTVNPVYSFTSASGDDPSRFLLTFSNVGIGETQKDNSIAVFTSGHDIFVVDNNGKTQGNVLVCNMIGQRILQQKTMGNLTKISLNATTGYYVVTVITDEHTYSGKVFIK